MINVKALYGAALQDKMNILQRKVGRLEDIKTSVEQSGFGRSRRRFVRVGVE
jgi:hypothetical protein